MRESLHACMCARRERTRYAPPYEHVVSASSCAAHLPSTHHAWRGLRDDDVMGCVCCHGWQLDQRVKKVADACAKIKSIKKAIDSNEKMLTDRPAEAKQV